MELIPDYIARKKGQKKISYLHPKLKPILENTYGIAIYQEQILRVVRDLAGFSLAEADVLRKAVGKKINKLLQEQKEKFIKGCQKNNIPEATAQKVFAFIEPFARYGFNRSHATCYATIAYQTAYLKAHYPTEFVAALLCADQNNIDKITTEIKAAEQMGLEILPPNINESFKDFTVVEESKIRFGLLAIKNVGQGISETIIQERKKHGDFQSLEDFLGRIHSKDLNKKSLESLIKSGALDMLGERNQMLNNIETLLDFSRKKQKDKANGQSTLFGMIPSHSQINNLNLKNTPPAKREKKLLWEKELLGLFVSEHPLKEYEPLLQKYTIPLIELENQNSSRKIKVMGIITKVKKILTSKKEIMKFVKIEDPSGETEIIVFPKMLRENSDFWEENKIVFVTGRISHKDESLKIIAEQAKKVEKETLDNLLLKNK
jgi:DNA polymerase-3 subunit alpha